MSSYWLNDWWCKWWSVASLFYYHYLRHNSKYDFLLFLFRHNSVPFVPEIVGIETFEGLALHSHCYRYPKTFENKKVLIIGSGPSGMDIVFEFGHITEKVCMN